MKLLVILLNIAFTLQAVADANLQKDDNSISAVPVIVTGVTSATSVATSFYTEKQAAKQDGIADVNERYDIPAAQRRLPEYEARVRDLEAIKPEQISRQEFRVTQSLPSGLGNAAEHAAYFQEYIEDSELANRANSVLDQMKSSVGHPATSREALDRIKELQNSKLEQEYEAIVQEAREKGLVKTRPANNVRKQFEYLENEEKIIAARLDREDLHHRGFVDQSAQPSRGKVFVLRLKKAYSTAAIEHVRATALADARDRLELQHKSIANKQTDTEKAKKSANTLRRATKLTRYGGIAGIIGSLGAGMLIFNGTSVDTQLLNDTNPSTISVEDPVPVTEARH